MSTAITINEVGLRDGFQNQSQFVTTDDKLRMIDALLAAGVSHFEVTSFVNPKAVPQMADADELFRRLPSQSGVTYSALVGNLRGCERAVSAGVRSLAYVLSATDTMNRRNINLDLGGALESAKSVLKFGLSHRLEMRAYVATAFGCPFEGHVAPTVVERLAAELLDAGAGEIIVADTIGVADPMHVSRLLGSRRTSWRAFVVGTFPRYQGTCARKLLCGLHAGHSKIRLIDRRAWRLPVRAGRAGQRGHRRSRQHVRIWWVRKRHLPR